MGEPPQKKSKFGLTFNLGTPPEETPRAKQPLPLRIIAVDDFGARPEARHAGGRAIDRESFGQRLESHGIELYLEVPDRLSDAAAPLRLQFAISDMQDFTPAGIIGQVPALTSLYLFLERLRMFARGEMPAGEFQSGLDAYRRLPGTAEALALCESVLSGKARPAARPGPKPSAARRDQAADKEATGVDRILDMVAGPGADAETETPPSGFVAAVNKVIDEIGRSAGRPPVAPEIAQAIVLTEKRLGRQIDEILHHPRFKEIETAWRGLRFLVDGTEAGEHIRIEFVDIAREDLPEAFHEQVCTPEHEGRSHVAPALIAVNVALDNRAADLTLLEGLGKDAEALQVPLLIGLAPGFLGLAEGSAAMPFPGSLLQRPEYDKWNAIRDKDCARWLCVLYNRFLLRPVHTAEGTKGLGVAETVTSDADYAFGSPVWFAARLAIRSFIEHGWPTEINGIRSGSLDGFDLHTVEATGQAPVAIPLQAPLTEQQVYDLAEQGIAPLVCRANRDTVHLLQIPMLYRPRRYNDPAATEADRARTTLSYQLFAARVAEAVATYKSNLVGETPQAIQEGLEGFLGGLLADTGAGAGVDVRLTPDPDRPGRQQVQIHLRAGRGVVNGAELGFQFPV